MITILLYKDSTGDSLKMSTQTSIDVDQLKLWTIPFVVGIPLWNLVLLNLFMQTRTRISFLPQVGILVCFLILNVAQASIASKVKTDDVSNAGESSGSFLIIAAGLECWSLLCVFSMCYFGRWNLELQERIEFWKFTKSNDHLRELRETQATRKRKSGSTAVEDLMHILVRAMTNVQDAEVTTGNKLLVESTELLRQIQDALTNTENLYAVRILQDPSSPELAGATQAVESALLEAKFYEIYGNRKIPLSQKPHRTKSEEERETGHIVASVCPKTRNFAPPPKASAAFRRGVGREWNCNILKAAEEYPNILVEVGALLLEPKSVQLGTSPIRIRNYVYRLERLYRVNPYHNSTHGAMVAHSMCCLLRMLGISESPCFPSLGGVVVVVSALGHDAGHPGRNNQFYVNAFQKMALLYNDKSVLENYHSALVFKSLEPKSCDIFEMLDTETVREVRKKIIELILATDMGLHFESVSKFRLRRQAAGFNFLTDIDDMWLVMRMCIKCADLSHALVDWNQHQAWSIRVVEEFYQQGEEEVQLGLPKSPLCDRSQHYDLAKSQKGFIEFVVQPLMSQMDELDVNERIADNCLRHLTYNKYKWEEFCRERKTLDIPQDIQDIRTDSTACRLLLFHLFVPKGYKLVPTETEGASECLSEKEKPSMSQDSDYFGSQTLDIDDETGGYSSALDSQDVYSQRGAYESGGSFDVEHSGDRGLGLSQGSMSSSAMAYVDADEEYLESEEPEHKEENGFVPNNSLLQPAGMNEEEWRGERSATLETARFGEDSLTDFGDDEDLGIAGHWEGQEQTSICDTKSFEDQAGGSSFWDDEEEDEMEAQGAEDGSFDGVNNYNQHGDFHRIDENDEILISEEEKRRRGLESASHGSSYALGSRHRLCESQEGSAHEASSAGTTDTAYDHSPYNYSSTSSGQTVAGSGGAQASVHQSLLQVILTNPATFFYLIESAVRPNID